METMKIRNLKMGGSVIVGETKKLRFFDSEPYIEYDKVTVLNGGKFYEDESAKSVEEYAKTMQCEEKVEKKNASVQQTAPKTIQPKPVQPKPRYQEPRHQECNHDNHGYGRGM